MKKGIYLFLTVLIVACSSDDNNNVDDTQAEWLYVHTAIEANATNSNTLVIPFTEDIFAFTDRPDREHKYISAEEFVSYWSDDATNSFQFDPPNAVFTSVDDDGIAEVEVVITGANTDGDNITYTIQNPKLTENATFEDVSLFVDGNGGDPCENNKVYLDGVTVKACSGAEDGDTGVINDVTYTVVNDVKFIEMVTNQEDVTKVVTTLVTDMSFIFNTATTFNQDISSWDVSNVTTMYQMFYGATAFNQDISSWDVSNVTDMYGMFGDTSAFNQDISSWNVSSVTNMNGMFYYATGFNQAIGFSIEPFTGNTNIYWDVSSVTDMSGMFQGATAFNQNLCTWSVTNVTSCDDFSAGATAWTLPQPCLSSCNGVNNPAIGLCYQGGIIFYIFQPGDTGYVAGETHGLIAATEDQSSGIQWSAAPIVTGATGTAIGTGLTNTNAIIAAQGSGSYAASIARDYNGGGYTDWFLPSKDELNQLWLNQFDAYISLNTIFSNYPGLVYLTQGHAYWSSTEFDYYDAWFQFFYQTQFEDGLQDNVGKFNTTYVRAVRAF
jgi:surface protein